MHESSVDSETGPLRKHLSIVERFTEGTELIGAAEVQL